MSAEYNLLVNMGAMLLAATFLAYMTHYLKQPIILGYVLAGLALGPFGIGLITNSTDIIALSELGIAFLLFGVGVEINLNKLRGMGFVSVIAGSIQVLATFGIGYLLVRFAGVDPITAIYLGLVLAFSSTMVVVKILADTFSVNTLHGRLMIGILVIQDILVIIAMSFMKNLGQTAIFTPLLGTLVNGLGLFAIALIVNKFVLPSLLRSVARSPELLFLTAVSSCFTFMGIAYFLGFSIAIGAFIAGLSISAFHYNIEVGAKIKPLRDFFSTIFFVSLGMQINIAIGSFELMLATVLIFATLILKPIIITIIYYAFGYGRTAFLTGMGLAQASEFSFIIAAAGLAAGHITSEIFSVITIVTIFSIVVTPYFIKYSNPAYEVLNKVAKKLDIKPSKWVKPKRSRETDKKEEFANHIILLGGHRMGSRILRSFKNKKPVVVVDFDPDIVYDLQTQGIKAIYGDIYNEHILQKLNFKKARLLISTIPDDEVVAKVIKRAKSENDCLVVLTKAEFAEDALMLYEAGADIVVLPDIVGGEKMMDYMDIALKNPKLLVPKRKKQFHFMEKELEFETSSSRIRAKLIDRLYRQIAREIPALEKKVCETKLEKTKK
ncbi:MAG: cation:proton antiporter [Candidatus Diapherotrites archaeon]|nr:cation:proton antiporter [Candidatus Diapherotrites archaeon]